MKNAKNAGMLKPTSGQFKRVLATKQKQNSSSAQNVNSTGENIGDDKKSGKIKGRESLRRWNNN